MDTLWILDGYLMDTLWILDKYKTESPNQEHSMKHPLPSGTQTSQANKGRVARAAL